MGTLKQAAKILSLFADTPTEQVQAILESGFLPDLCDGNIAEVRRDDLRKLLGLVPLSLSVMVLLDPAKPFVRDMTKDGWRLESDIKYDAKETALQPCEFLKPGESHMKGTEMAKRAKSLGANLGQKHAEFLLENQHLIPAEWINYYFTFPGTVWQDALGYRSAPYLFWSGKRWYLDFNWLDGDWYSHDRLLRPCK